MYAGAVSDRYSFGIGISRYIGLADMGKWETLISIGYWSISVRLRIQLRNSKLWLPGKNTILDAWFITTK